VHIKSTAILWKQSRTSATKYRDRKRVTLPNGERKEMYGYGPTKQAATEDLYAKVEAATQSHPVAETITVTQLFAEFLQHKRSVKGNKAKTIHDDLEMFRLNIQPAIGEKALADVTLTEIQGVQHALTKRGKWRSAERCTILMKALLTFAVRRYRAEIAAGRLHLVSRDDVDNIKRPPGTKRKVNPLWTFEQVQAFLALAKVRYNKHPRNIMYPLFYAALEAGLRRGELIGMQRSALSSIQLRGSTQHFLSVTEQIVYYGKGGHHDTPKTPDSNRIIPITQTLAEILRRHMERMDRAAEREGYEPNTLMFPSWNGTPLTPRNLYRARDSLIAALGFTKSTLHEMRKASNTHFTLELMRQGKYSPKTVQRRLGHANSAVAMEIYTLVSEDDYMGATLSFETAAGMDAGMEANEEDADF
jgi:integrase